MPGWECGANFAEAHVVVAHKVCIIVEILVKLLVEIASTIT